ncbi:MAG: hypothetical protein ACLTSD_06665 [Eubacterium sp.]
MKPESLLDWEGSERQRRNTGDQEETLEKALKAAQEANRFVDIRMA